MQITIFPYASDLGQIHYAHTVQKCLYTLYKSFQLRISTVDVIKFAGNWAFVHIYWRNP